MLISQIFPSKYITAADLQGRTITLTITNVTMEEMLTHENKKATKPVAWFERTNKGFVMNLTNAKIVAQLYGDETDGWTGKRISVYPTRVKAFGSMTDCIRVREEIPAQPRPTQTAQVEEASGLDDDEDVADYEEDEGQEPQQAKAASKPVDNPFEEPTRARANADQLKEINRLGPLAYPGEWATNKEKLAEWTSQGARNTISQLYDLEASKLIKALEKKLQDRLVQVAQDAVPVAA